MLKNKKVIYALLPLNVLIWGFFIYRFYAAFHESDALPPESGPLVAKSTGLKDSVNYRLSLDYKDPFLKQVARSEEHRASGSRPVAASAPTLNAVPKAIKTSTATPPPDIKYLGLIRNSSSGLTKALVSINGQSRLIQEKDVVDGVTFKSLSRDSLVARFGRERIVARK